MFSVAFVILLDGLVTESLEKLGVNVTSCLILPNRAEIVALFAAPKIHHDPSNRRPPHHPNLQIARMRPEGPLVPLLHSSAAHSESPSARGDLILMLDPKPFQVKVKTFDALAFPSPLLDSNITGAKKLVSNASSR